MPLSYTSRMELALQQQNWRQTASGMHIPLVPCSVTPELLLHCSIHCNLKWERLGIQFMFSAKSDMSLHSTLGCDLQQTGFDIPATVCQHGI